MGQTGLVIRRYGMVGAPEDYPGLCATIEHQGQEDAQIGRDPVKGFDDMETRMRAEGIITTMTQEEARTCYMQGFNKGRLTPKQAGVGGLLIGGGVGILVGVLGTLAVQKWSG